MTHPKCNYQAISILFPAEIHLAITLAKWASSLYVKVCCDLELTPSKIWLPVDSKGEPWQTLLFIYSKAIPTPLLPCHLPLESLEHQILIFLASLAGRGAHVTQR